MTQFLSCAACDRRFLVAGVDEREIFLTVIVEPEGCRYTAGILTRRRCWLNTLGKGLPFGAAHVLPIPAHARIRPRPRCSAVIRHPTIRWPRAARTAMLSIPGSLRSIMMMAPACLIRPPAACHHQARPAFGAS